MNSFCIFLLTTTALAASAEIDVDEVAASASARVSVPVDGCSALGGCAQQMAGLAVQQAESAGQTGSSKCGPGR